jgi:hypothetical protein
MARHQFDERSRLIGDDAEPAAKARLAVNRANVGLAEVADNRARAGAEDPDTSHRPTVASEPNQRDDPMFCLGLAHGLRRGEERDDSSRAREVPSSERDSSR